MKTKSNTLPWIIAAVGAAIVAYVVYRLFLKKPDAELENDLPPVLPPTIDI